MLPQPATSWDAEEAFFAVDYAFLFADGEATAEDLVAVRSSALDALDLYGFTALAVYQAVSSVTAVCAEELERTAAHVTEALGYIGLAAPELRAEQAGQCELLRCIFGNPFRPITPDPAWQMTNIVTLARSIYDDRRFDVLPLLADLLEEAGAPAELSGHCRAPGPHVLGCWALDLILGKS
jgi:hypothetical protein